MTEVEENQALKKRAFLAARAAIAGTGGEPLYSAFGADVIELLAWDLVTQNGALPAANAMENLLSLVKNVRALVESSQLEESISGHH